ncbi:hypothetical protein GF406_07055 [candidate division KSB1 bacterium]|nr:hypothetical protein [candidate division KSB1 bacterium]
MQTKILEIITFSIELEFGSSVYKATGQTIQTRNKVFIADNIATSHRSAGASPAVAERLLDVAVGCQSWLCRDKPCGGLGMWAVRRQMSNVRRQTADGRRQTAKEN